MEFVWVVPRAEVLPDPLHGLLPLAPEEMEGRFLGPARSGGFFCERRYAEAHPEFKQIIPYVAVCREQAGVEQVLCLTRLPSQGERRLHGKRSIGVGGHVNPCDQADGACLFERALRRELHEELRLPAETPAPVPIGVLNDDRTEVGAVHLGVVYRLDATGLPVSIRETGAMTGGFESLAELERLARGEAGAPFESWSGLLLRSGVLRGASASSPI
ncbi:MAG: phosphoesterase [Planctomycetota bacterium]|nr:MAG: phosphoesterase [Planctomycetota bacterium]